MKQFDFLTFYSQHTQAIWFVLCSILVVFIYFKWLHKRIGLNTIQTFFFLGITLIIFDLSGFIENELLNRIIGKIGDVFAISGVIGYLSSIDDILRPYRNELRSIIYFEKEYLAKLNPTEIENVWLNSSELYFNNRFKNINSDLLELLKNEYFSNKSKMYYENMDIVYVIRIIDEKSQLISVEETTKMTIYTENTSEQEYKLDSTIDISPDIKDKCTIELKIMKINGEDVLNKNEITTFAKNISDESVKFSVLCKLSDKLVYTIHRKIKKTYSLKYDNSICYKSKHITRGLSVTFNVPKSLRLNVMERGLIGNFDLDNKETIPDTCKFTYSDLILPKQGFSTIINMV